MSDKIDWAPGAPHQYREVIQGRGEALRLREMKIKDFVGHLEELAEAGMNKPRVCEHRHPLKEGGTELDRRVSYYACGPIRATREDAYLDLEAFQFASEERGR